MKKITLLVIICLLTLASAQSQCKKIKIVDDEMKGIRTIASPYNSPINLLTGISKKGGALNIIKVVKPNISSTTITFSGAGGISLIGSRGLYIKFSNGEIQRFADIEINSSYISNGQYMYSAILSVDEDNSNNFKESEIIQFDLSIYKYKVKERDSKEFKEFVNCVLENN